MVKKMKKYDVNMDLPKGKQCKDCYAFSFCKVVIGKGEKDTICDYYPVRFKQKVLDVDVRENQCYTCLNPDNSGDGCTFCIFDDKE
jgi:hypothetical protein